MQLFLKILSIIANSVDPDHTAPSGAVLKKKSDLGLHCLHRPLCDKTGVQNFRTSTIKCLFVFVCVEVLWPSQPNVVMSSAVSLPNHTFTG